MQTQIKTQFIIACVLGALSIIIGAFSAHWLEKLVEKNILTNHQLNIFEKGVRYQMYFAILLLILSLFNINQNQIVFYKSYYIFLFGVILFSGSLYWIVLQKMGFFYFPRFLFWITPLGGILMILGWILVIYEVKSFLVR
jgi:uncharacterized membrane protein YgdD (TMEM256/DUF423 family)